MINKVLDPMSYHELSNPLKPNPKIVFDSRKSIQISSNLKRSTTLLCLVRVIWIDFEKGSNLDYYIPSNLLNNIPSFFSSFLHVPW